MEIERKFLVDTNQWESLEKPAPQRIRQGYLSASEGLTVRVRTKGSTGYLTIKGKTTGISREEFEYEIPLQDAEQLLDSFTDRSIDKWRYEIQHAGKTWEVDVFLGALSPLILAEIELSSEDEVFEKPSWVTEDVSLDPQYYNANLINRFS